LLPLFFVINSIMSTVKTQPDKLDYASPTQFKFGIHQLPKVEFFSTAATIPAIALADVLVPTPFKSLPMMGDQLTYDNLSVSFIVDEYLENYLSIHEWMTAIGFPKNRTQFSEFKSNTSNTPSAASVKSNDIGDVQKPSPSNALFSDATLTVLSNKNNPIVNVFFRDIYPVAMTGLSYNQGATDVEYLTAEITFAYQLYEIEAIS
jgi:hypothetical protein